MTVTLEALFTEANFTPNPAQHQAILHQGSPLFLVAGPGSGKTRVLLWRTVNLIVFKDVKPEDIFLATFTEKAAKQLRDGLISLLGLAANHTGINYDISQMYIGTVHSLCQRLLKDRRLTAGRQRQQRISIIDEVDQYFLLYRKAFWQKLHRTLGDPRETVEDFIFSVNDLLDQNSSSRHKAVLAIRSIFNRFSEENLSPSQIESSPDSKLQMLGKMYRLYLDELGERVDLSLLQQAAYQLLMHTPEGGSLFQHVIIDEYQDTNAIQEKLYFRLALGHQNICVVGDDDQALYRFRGATVENFVQFAERVKAQLHCQATQIKLNVNYRSRSEVVNHYTRFMEGFPWEKPTGGHYRLHDKGITAHSTDFGAAVVASSQASQDVVCEEIADLVCDLIRTGKVQDPNQIAFLFPSVKAPVVQRFRRALEDEKRGLKVYAPRSVRFLENDEPSALIGMFAVLFGPPEYEDVPNQGEFAEFVVWLRECQKSASEIIKADLKLKQFIQTKKDEIKRVQDDYGKLLQVITQQGWNLSDPYIPSVHKRALLDTSITTMARQGLGTKRMDDIAVARHKDGEPFTLSYMVNRAASLDWNTLDLFYRLCAFEHFQKMFDLAENGVDEGPIWNLSLTAAYLARFAEQYQTVITGGFLANHQFSNVFFGSYLLALFRLGESEYEDEDNPFPKGRIPFLTIHQSKGLEFPVVILGSVNRRSSKPQMTETLVRPLLTGDLEPLDQCAEFDTMRMFYVALSRAQNLLVIANPRGQGITTYKGFQSMLNGNIRRVPELHFPTLPEHKETHQDATYAYSYTGDFLAYLQCPRQYMIFRKYDFPPSRSQSMFFGSLVHQTIEDLHHHLIQQRNRP